MRVRCLHGYFIFEEQFSGEVSKFNSLYDIGLAADGPKYTFDSIKNAPRHSIAGGTYLDAVATSTFAGEPWEVMEANNLVYNFLLDLVMPITLITQLIKIQPAGDYFAAAGLILPGSITQAGDRVKNYDCRFSFDTMKFKYTEVSYV